MAAVGHTNALAGLLVMTLPMLAYLIAAQPSTKRGQIRSLRFMSLFCIGLLSVAILFCTLSRACWLAGLLGALFLFVTWPSQVSKRRLFIWSVELLCGLAVLGFLCQPALLHTLKNRLVTVTDSSGRPVIWRAAVAIFTDSPWFGCGLDTFGLAFTRHRGPQYWQIEWGILPDQAHNECLQTLSTQGLVGLIAYLGLRVAVVYSFVRAWRDHAEQRLLLLVVMACLLIFDVQHLFGFVACPTGVLLACSLGWLARLAAPLSADLADETVHRPLPVWLLPLCACSVGLF